MPKEAIIEEMNEVGHEISEDLDFLPEQPLHNIFFAQNGSTYFIINNSLLGI